MNLFKHLNLLEAFGAVAEQAVIQIVFLAKRHATDRRKTTQRKPTASLMKITDAHSRLMKKESRTMESRTSFLERYNVFLGGSCGGRKSPTTWRKEVAIPLLTKNDITFFNPQVDTWTHDLIFKENKAKENSDWLLFMLESSTRGIVSLVEIAYHVGTGRSVIFVQQEERECGQLCIKEDTVSKLERDDIMESQQTLNSIIGKHDRCQYFSVLEKGLHHVIDGLKMSTGVESHGNSYSSKNVKKYHDIFQKLSSVFIRTNKPCDENGRKRRPSHLKITNPIQKYTLGIICAENANSLVEKLERSRSNFSKDSIYVAQGSGTEVTDTLMQCSAILVVIPSTSLGCAAMCKAAYMLTKCKNMVMCIQDVFSETVDNGNTMLTTSAVDDFNRARRYLTDMAVRHNVSVCSSVDQAVNLVGQKVKRRPSIFSVISED